MQQRLQIARNLVTGPRLVFMDEPTGGLDVSVQARLLDLLRGLVREMGLSAIIVTHDLAVVRLLADRLMVMKDGPCGGTGSDRSGAGRSAACLYAASGVLGVAGLRPMIRRSIRIFPKAFTLHNQGGAVIPVMAGRASAVAAGRMRRADRCLGCRANRR